MSARFIDAKQTNTRVRRLLEAGWTHRQIITRAYTSNGHGRDGWPWPTTVSVEVAARIGCLDPADPPDPPAHVAHETPAWYADAACRGSDPGLFFPDPCANIDAEVRAVCAGCPVREDCADHAIERNEKHGIWGGLSEKQRRRVRRDRRWQVSA